MRVYRCITLQEVINKYTNQKIEEGYNNRLNTHNYQLGIKYIHFFRYEEFAKYYFYLEESYEKLNNNHILFMVANIPEELLEKYKGFGFYTYKNQNYPMPEYAIPASKFLPEFIVNISTKPNGYTRKREAEEFKKYMEFVEKLKNSNMEIKNIAEYFLENNLEKLLEMKIDKRTEEEIDIDIDKLLSTVSFPINEDIPIEEFRRK